MSEHEARKYLTVTTLLACIKDRLTTSEELLADLSESSSEDEFIFDRDRAQVLDLMTLHGKPLGNLHGIPVALALNKPEGFTGNSTVEDLLNTHGALAVILNSDKIKASSGATDVSRNALIASIGQAVLESRPSLGLGIGRGYDFCLTSSDLGLFSYVPSFGSVPRHGLTDNLNSLDRVGLLANFIEDIANFGDLVSHYDSRDGLNLPYPPPNLVKTFKDEPPVSPALCTYNLNDIRSDYVEDFNLVINELDTTKDRVELPDFSEMIFKFETALMDNPDKCYVRKSLYEEIFRPGDKKSVEGQTLTDMEEIFLHLGRYFERFFLDYDALILPASQGDRNGDGFISPITKVAEICGLPMITLPVLKDKNDEPLGLQLIGKYWEDDRLMRTTNWIINQLFDFVDESK
ncbi:MAG: amidase family protein [Rhodobacteraceae bacterium]|nr:amidase family protein [Paracoccaceae bacterium]